MGWSLILSADTCSAYWSGASLSQLIAFLYNLNVERGPQSLILFQYSAPNLPPIHFRPLEQRHPKSISVAEIILPFVTVVIVRVSGIQGLLGARWQ